MEILRVENLTFTYPKETEPVLKNVSFSLNEGDFALVCGASGGGKTTLLRMIKHSLAPVGKSDGKIFFGGEDVTSLSPERIAGDIGFVFQSSEHQIVCDTVERELALGLCCTCSDTEKIRRRVGETAGYFGLDRLMRRKTSELSGGERQKLCIASVMAMNPRLLVLDEPLASLDPVAATELISVLRRIVRDIGTTVVMSCHNPGEIISPGDKVIFIDKGEAVLASDPQEICAAMMKNPAITAPASARIFALTGGNGKMPLTISEGKQYLRKFDNKIGKSEHGGGMPSGETALKMKNVYFRYSRELADIISGCDINVFCGEIFSVLGGNGAGKSTLLSIMCGLLSPWRGKIEIFSKSIDKYGKNELYRGVVGALPQNAEELFCGDTVREVISENHGEDEWLPIIRKFGLEPLLSRHPLDLSGGEAQRLALAKVLLRRPRLLLLDEPTSSLDAQGKLSLKEILLDLKKQGVTIIFVTHDTEFAAEISDRCALLFGGEITSVDTPERFFSENDFYTTGASLISRGQYDGAVTPEEVAALCLKNGEKN